MTIQQAEQAAGVRLEKGREYEEQHARLVYPESAYAGTFCEADAALTEAYAVIVRLAGERDRFRQDRYDALSVYSTDGLLSSEWVARTGAAERRAKQAEADLAAAREEARKLRLAMVSVYRSPLLNESQYHERGEDIPQDVWTACETIRTALARYQPPTKSQVKRIAAQRGEEGGPDA